MSYLSIFFKFKWIFLFLGILLFPELRAQQSVGIGTSSPNPNAILDIKSDKQGLLVPRLNSSQKTQMAQILQSSSGNEGMIIFDTEQGKFYYWFAGKWNEGLGALTSSAVEGDLQGNLPSPLVIGLQGRALSATVPTNNQVLKWNGSAWTPAADIGVEYTAGGGIQISAGQIINSGDLNGSDDVLKTDIAGGDLSGTFDNLAVRNSAINTVKIADEAITTAKIADQNITSQKIADEAITLEKIDAGSPNSFLSIASDGTLQWESKNGIMNSSLDEGQILIGNAAGVAQQRIISGNLTINAAGEATIADNSINSSNIVDGGIATVDITNDAITREKIAADIAGAGLVQETDGSLGVNPGTGLSITGDNLNLTNTGVVTGAYGQNDKVAQFTVDAQGRIVSVSELAIEASPAGIAGGELNGNYPNPTIRDGVITQTKIADDAVGLPQIKNDDPNKMMITDPSGNPRWFEPYANQVIITGNDGRISSEARSAFATPSLPPGNVFVGSPGGVASPLPANSTGHILIGNGSGLSSVNISGDIDMNITGSTIIQPGVVNNSKIANEAVNSAKIEDGSIATIDLANASVTSTKIIADAVTTDKIANGTIRDADLNKTVIPLSGFGAAAANINLGSYKLEAVADPTNNQDAATKKYVDDLGAADGDKDATNELQDLSLSGNALTLTDDLTPVDLTPYLDNTDNQQLTRTGNSLDLEDGGSVDLTPYLDNTDNQNLSEVLSEDNDADGNVITNLGTPVDDDDAATKIYVDALGAADGDKDATNELQDLSLSGNALTLTDDLTPVDLSSYLDNTDNQQLTRTGNSLDLEDGGSVDLTPYLDNTDNQNLSEVLSESNDADGSVITNLGTPVDDDDAATKIYVDALGAADGDKDATNELQDLSLSGNALTLTDDLTPVDLTPYLDNTDNQQLTRTGNSLDLEDGGSVDLTPYLDNTDNQNLSEVLSEDNDADGNVITNLGTPVDDDDAATKIYVDALGAADGDKDATNELQDLSLSGNALTLTDDLTPVDLSSYLDNTDNQQLTRTGNSLDLEDGGSVDLTPYLDNTDNQNLSEVLSEDNDADGNVITNLGTPVDDDDAVTKIYVDALGAADGDKDATNELQDLSLSGNALTLTDDLTPVDLSSYLDNTDNQQLTRTGNSLDLEDGGSVDLTPYLDNTDNQNLSEVLSESNDADGSVITNLGTPVDDDDAATKIYVDALINADGDKDASNELQDLLLTGNSLSLTDDLTPVDLSSYLDNTDNQQLTLSGNSLDLDNSGNVDLTPYLDNTDNQNLSEVLSESNDADGNVITNLGTPVDDDDAATKIYVDALGAADGDKDATNELQDLSLTGNSLSLTDDLTPVDLSSYLDNTDNQQLTLSGNSLDLDNSGNVDLTPYLDNTDNQNLSEVLSESNDADGRVITNLGTPVDDDDAATKIYVDALGAADGDKDATNELQDLSLTGNSLSLTDDLTPVDLSSYLDNTDNQQLTLSGNSLDLDNSGNVDLTPYLDNTDNQNLSEVLSESNDADGNVITNLGTPVDDDDAATKIYVDALINADGDKDASNELQTISLTGEDLILSNGGGTVDLTTYNNIDEVVATSGLTGGGSTSSVSLGIATGGVTSTHIQNNTITNTHIVNGTINFEKMNQSGANGGQVMIWSNFLNKWTPGNATAILGGSSGDITSVTTPPGSGLQGGSESGDAILSLTNSGSGEILIGNGTNVNATTITGDISLSSTGVATINNNTIENANISDGAVSTAKIEDGAITAQKIDQMAATNGAVIKWNGTSWAPAVDNVNDLDFDPANEIQNLSIAGNEISLTGSSPINLSNTAPAENQVLTWQAGGWRAATVSATAGVTTKTGYYSVDPLDFQGIGKDGAQKVYYHNGTSGGAFVATDETGGIAAPMHLPHGAIVNSITFYFRDQSGSENLTFRVQRKVRTGIISQTLASYTSTGTPGDTFAPVSSISNATIDNSLYTYRVLVDMKKDGYDDSQHRVYSVVIEYTEEIAGITAPAGAVITNTYKGPGVPSNATGVNGDFYVDETYDELYSKINGNWVKVRLL